MPWLRYRLARLDGDQRTFGVAFLLLLALYLAPLFQTPFLPGLDLPFHLSMADMLAKSGRPDNPYATWYEARLGIAPYAAHYFALIALGHVMSLVNAHLVITMAYVAGLPLSMAWLLSSCGRSRLPALLGFPLAYNLTFHYGFVSFAFSLPVLFLLLAALTRLLTADEARPRPPTSTLALTAAMAVLLFLCHLQNFLYGFCAALAFVVFCRAGLRRRGWALLALGPSLACLAFWQRASSFADDPNEQKKTLSFAWTQLKLHRLANLGRRTWAEDLTERVEHLPNHILRGFADLVHVRAAETLFVVLAACFLIGALGWLLPRPGAQRSSRMRLAVWVAFAGAALAYFALPHHLPSFELMTFYPRFSVLLAGMLIPLVPSGLARFRGVGRVVVGAPIVLFTALYGRELVDHYRAYGDEIADFATVLEASPPGLKAQGIIFNRRSNVLAIESPFVGMASLYVAAKPSPSGMVPVWYCGLRHMPCRPRPGAPPLPDAGPWNPAGNLAAAGAPFFDLFFVRHQPIPGLALFAPAADAFGVVSVDRGWAAYRRLPPPPPAPPPAAAPPDGGASDASSDAAH